MKNLLRVAITTISLIVLTSCAAPKNNAAPMSATINTKCVLSGEDLKADSPSVDYMGKKVGFCCEHCVEKWNGMTDAAKQAAVAAVK